MVNSLDNADKEAAEINKPFLRSWWIERTMGIVIIVLAFAVLALSSVILWLLPLKEIKHVLLTGYNKDSQVIKVEPIEKSTYGWNKLMEIYSKDFVTALHTIDGQTEMQRLKKLSLMASSETLDFLESELNTSNNSSNAKKVFDSGITRSIEIKGVTSLAPDAPNTWQIDFETVDYDHSKNVQRRTPLVAIITADTKARTFHLGEEELNPLGFTVIKYSLRVGNYG